VGACAAACADGCLAVCRSRESLRGRWPRSLPRRPTHRHDPEKLKAARQLYDARQHTIAEIAATLGVSRASIYRSLNDTAAGPR
jgi:DNA invertase Pin-like site-specific DNA recombinase